MSLFISSLNSGSNGNCYYIGNDTDAVLIDAGISCRETERRMKRLGLEAEKLRAIFVTHEHSDHITGICGLSKKYRLPVYITPATQIDCKLPFIPELVLHFVANTPIQIGALTITGFSKRHDAVDPHSFIVSSNDTCIGIFTDIGSPCKNLIRHFSQCQAIFLESNYCANMLESGSYPYYLKKRINGDNGHLSNDQALELFRKHRGPQLTHLILSHLSKNNNDPALVQQLFQAHAGNTQIIVASRYEETPVFEIHPPTAAPPRAGYFTRKPKSKASTDAQLSLF